MISAVKLYVPVVSIDTSKYSVSISPVESDSNMSYSIYAPEPVPSISRDEIANLIAEKLREAQPPAKKYHYVNGMYVKIK